MFILKKWIFLNFRFKCLIKLVLQNEFKKASGLIVLSLLHFSSPSPESCPPPGKKSTEALVYLFTIVDHSILLFNTEIMGSFRKVFVSLQQSAIKFVSKSSENMVKKVTI